MEFVKSITKLFAVLICAHSKQWHLVTPQLKLTLAQFNAVLFAFFGVTGNPEIEERASLLIQKVCLMLAIAFTGTKTMGAFNGGAQHLNNTL